MPIFRVKSVKIYTGQKNLHGYTCGIRDKLEVCLRMWGEWFEALFKIPKLQESAFSQGADNDNSSFFATNREENCEKEKDKQVLCVW